MNTPDNVLDHVSSISAEDLDSDFETFQLTVDGKSVYMHIRRVYLHRPYIIARGFQRLIEEAMMAGILNPRMVIIQSVKATDIEVKS